MGWIGVDLDGTLAHYDGWHGEHEIGEPISKMANRVRVWLIQGKDVRIFTARVSVNKEFNTEIIQNWTEKHFGQRLPVTNEKDYEMIELWDDRAVQVEHNTGRRIDGK